MRNTESLIRNMKDSNVSAQCNVSLMSPTGWPEARANLNKSKKSLLLLSQHQSTYPRGPESVSIEIPLSDLTS